MTTLGTIEISTRLLGFSLAIQAHEQLRIAGEARFVAPPFRSRSSLILGPLTKYFSGTLLLFSLALVASGDPRLLLAALPIAYAINLRFGGTFNGGSDYLTFVVGLPLALFALHPSERVAIAAVSFIGVQLVLSYTIAGFAKLRAAEWRSGSALSLLAERGHYALPTFGRRLLEKPRVAKLLGHSTVVFECAAPLALLDPKAMLGFSIVALGFHLGVAWFLGLNRFVWAWLAAFPSAYGLAKLLANANS